MSAAEAFDLEALFAALNSERHVAVAVSGGSDSMALFHLVRAWAARWDVSLTVMVFDHGLRTESSHEAAQVRFHCASLGVACEVLQWSGEKPNTGLQAGARRARYDALTKCCTEIGATVLLTGHTENDQAETVAMRRARTDSELSQVGIWPETKWNGVRVVRPLLGVRREALRNFLRTQSISWVDDPSNVNPKFERVRVREALPVDAISSLAAAAQASLAKVGAAAGVVKAWGDHLTCDWYGVVRFELLPFLALDRLSRAFALRRAFVVFGAGARVERAEMERLTAWLEGEANGQRALGGVIFRKNGEQVEMLREVARIPRATKVSSGPYLWDGRFVIEAPEGSIILPCLKHPDIPRNPQIPAVVQQGLPCVVLPDGALAVPHLGLGEGVQLHARPTQ